MASKHFKRSELWKLKHLIICPDKGLFQAGQPFFYFCLIFVLFYVIFKVENRGPENDKRISLCRFFYEKL